MARAKTTRKTATAYGNSAYKMRDKEAAGKERKETVHIYGSGVRCDTDSRGHATPRGRSPLEIAVDASEGFIPLWTKNQTLRWRFRESSMDYFQNPTSAKAAIKELFGVAILAWGTAAPIKFAQQSDVWDFEIVMRWSDDCDGTGCVLAAAFFPDEGRHKLTLYPKMFTQSRQEQVETLVHEIGHIYGLRHFFANVSETEWPSEIFGTHTPFSIMNYGSQSVLTSTDKSDLKQLYSLAWSGELTDINGTPIRLMRPYHTFVDAPDELVAIGQNAAAFQPARRASLFARL
jgi:hypothetical protein